MIPHPRFIGRGTGGQALIGSRGAGPQKNSD